MWIVMICLGGFLVSCGTPPSLQSSALDQVTATAQTPTVDQATADQAADTDQAPTPTAEQTPTVEQTPAVEQPADLDVDSQPVSLRLAEVARGLTRPLFVTHAGDGSGRLFVVEKGGTIRLLPDGELFLDISDRVGSEQYEQGLLSLVFHPDFADNGFFYVNYTDVSGDTVVSRFTLTSDGRAGDPSSEQIILHQDQPGNIHNGGMMAFGPDGYLYIALGDGGGPGGIHNAQNRQTLLGSLLRIDVDRGDPYAIPVDNPFVDEEKARPEIWAKGLRNPWRFSFDRATGDLYIGVVGEGSYEAVYYQPAGGPGGQNYGWPLLEGSHCFQGKPCDRTGMTEPIAEYDHRAGCASVTGGYVYRGPSYPHLQGSYLFGDYCSGQVWRLARDPAGAWSMTELLDTEALISSFGEDEAGELYLVDIGAGVVYRLIVQ